jgi:hypothetical protein
LKMRICIAGRCSVVSSQAKYLPSKHTHISDNATPSLVFVE